MKFLIEAAKERQSKHTEQGKVVISLHMKIMEMLQDLLIDGIIDGQVNHEERMGIVCLVIIMAY